MKKVTFIIGPNEQIEFKTDREGFINDLKLSFKNKQPFEINLGNEIVLLNLDKILFVKIKEVTE